MNRSLGAVFLVFAACVLPPFDSCAQSHELDWNWSLYGAGSTEHALPFWAVTNRHGLVPNAHSGFMTAGVDYHYMSKRMVHFRAGLELTGAMVPVALSGASAAPMLQGVSVSSARASSVWHGMSSIHSLGFMPSALQLPIKEKTMDALIAAS